jgi:hypothetical protein
VHVICDALHVWVLVLVCFCVCVCVCESVRVFGEAALEGQ